MNKLLPITIFSLLFIIGCENFFGDRNDSGDPYAYDMLLYDLEQDLALSSKQISYSKDFLRNGRDFFPDNASLWKLASYLQQNLTQEQKERLLSPPEDLISEEITEENDYHHKRLRHHHRMDEFIRSILSADQLSDYNEMVTYKKDALDEVYNDLKAGSQTKKEAYREMMGVMEWFRAAMDKLLTDDQNFIGAAADGSWGYDPLHDAPEPPNGPGNYIKLFLCELTSFSDSPISFEVFTM